MRSPFVTIANFALATLVFLFSFPLPTHAPHTQPKNSPSHAFTGFLGVMIQTRIQREELSSSVSNAPAQALAQALLQAAQRHRLDPLLLLAVATQESRVNPRAIGRNGEVGLMQLKLSTAVWVARRLGLPPPTREALFDPNLNLTLAAAYLSYLQEQFPNSPTAFLSAYNLGPRGYRHQSKAQGRVQYHQRVLRHYDQLLQDVSRAGLSAPTPAQAVREMRDRS
ncbi:MAG: lytic transglycosylase domain-containing protein [Bdellovibrionaceae bacterium]|nr:lytic transglycosylase domain-containing protein [Pseudobdellovibrionaceae bacterium]